MTGLDGRRVYLDWNATAPLRPEAREAILAAMDAVGNPSSVHAEGRAARAIVERARGRVAGLVGCAPDEVVFTSGATEAANAVFAAGYDNVWEGEAEHDAVSGASLNARGPLRHGLQVPLSRSGTINLHGLADPFARTEDSGDGLVVACAAYSETGVLNDWAAIGRIARGHGAAWLCDATQAVGKTGFDAVAVGADHAFGSAHKIGGPKGVGFVRVPAAITRPFRHIRGGGQERGRRSGTENVIGIAGFGAAAEAARRDLADGLWERVAHLRNILESEVEAAAPDVTFLGREAVRLPNTTYFAAPGWKGETQVMALDLAGFAVSAGSACSSGKVAESRVLRAMGVDAETARSAIRVSLGPTTTEGEVRAFAAAWKTLYAKRARRAALAG
ncbi:MAG: cysteine desulfurase family protein [Paracoccaceae bacterium]